jgi:RNA polymerase sigma-70 factor, ECF subfamily
MLVQDGSSRTRSAVAGCRPWRMTYLARSAEAAASEEAADVRLPSFEEFYEAHHRRLFVSLCLVTGDRQEAEEVMQEAFVRLLERWDRLPTIDDPSGYLFRVSMNVFRNRYRRAKLALRRTFEPGAPADDLAVVEGRDAVVRALRTLTPQQRQAAVLTWLLGYSSEEAGRMLGIRASTVRVLTSRARAAMREKADELR